jgi:hypothetical protein
MWRGFYFEDVEEIHGRPGLTKRDKKDNIRQATLHLGQRLLARPGMNGIVVRIASPIFH